MGVKKGGSSYGCGSYNRSLSNEEGHTLLSISCQVSARFGICAVVGVIGTLAAKMFTFTVTHFILSSTIKCLIRPTTVQMPNLALVEMKRISVYAGVFPHILFTPTA